MHSLDRIAGWLTAASVVGVAAILSQDFDFLLDPGFSPAEVVGHITARAVFDMLWLVFVIWSLWGFARGARRRERSRRRALAGDLSAMPLARPLAPNGEDATQETEPLPLKFLWRGKRRVDGVIATEHGLIRRRGRKREVLLPWSEARLFEAWDFMGLSGYSLHGQGTQSIDWLTASQSQRKMHPDDDISLMEMRRRERALVHLITARTGLALRTLAPALRDYEPSAEVSSAPVDSRRFSLLGMTVLALLVVVPLVEAVGILLVPLSGTPAFDYYAAGTMTAVGLFLLVAEIVALSGFKRDPIGAVPPILELPMVLPQAGGIYRIRWSASWRQRFIGLLAGLALLADLAPAIAGFGGTPPSPHMSPLLLLLHGAVIYTLLGIVFLGVTVASVAAFEGSQLLIADTEGLSLGTGKEREILGWSEIGVLFAHASEGNFVSFRAIGGGLDQTTIAWPARAKWDRAQAAIGQPEASRAIAAIVAQRTGLSWTGAPEE